MNPLLVPALSNLAAESNLGREDVDLLFIRWDIFEMCKVINPGQDRDL